MDPIVTMGDEPNVDAYELGGALQLDRVCRAVRAGRVGRRVLHRLATTSTNDEAWQLVEATRASGDGTADGVVIFAEHQSAGRGRLGRSWQAPRGASILLSVILEEAAPPGFGGVLGLLAGIAVHDAVVGVTDVRPRLKWPNDVLVGGRKLAGVLIESRQGPGAARTYVVGIGINCLQHRGHFPPELAEKATSLELASAHPIDRSAVAGAVLDALNGWLAKVGPDDEFSSIVSDAWRERAEPPAGRVAVQHSGQVFTGEVVEFEPLTGLVLRLEDGGTRLFPSGEATLVES